MSTHLSNKTVEDGLIRVSDYMAILLPKTLLISKMFLLKWPVGLQKRINPQSLSELILGCVCLFDLGLDDTKIQ